MLDSLLDSPLGPFLETTSFASPNSPRKETSFASMEESIRPSNSKTSPSVQPETSSRKVVPSDFTTPKKVSFEEDGLSRFTDDPSPRIITPLSCEPSATHHKKKTNQFAIVASTLIASSLASNAESHLVL